MKTKLNLNQLMKKNVTSKGAFAYLANRKRSARTTKYSELRKAIKKSQPDLEFNMKDLVSLMRDLETAGVGQVLTDSFGTPKEFLWEENCVDVGKIGLQTKTDSHGEPQFVISRDQAPYSIRVYLPGESQPLEIQSDTKLDLGKLREALGLK